MKKSSNKGFTLVELIIVIAILAIIMLIAIPNFSGIQQRMQVRADKATAAQIGKAVRVWFTDYTTDATLAAAGSGTLPSGLAAPTAAKTVVLEKYGDLRGINGYITAGQQPKSLTDADNKNIAGEYCVFLSADSTNAAAKIAIAIAATEGAKTKIEGIGAATDGVYAVTVAYDGKTSATVEGAVAYVEP